MEGYSVDLHRINKELYARKEVQVVTYFYMEFSESEVKSSSQN